MTRLIRSLAFPSRVSQSDQKGDVCDDFAQNSTLSRYRSSLYSFPRSWCGAADSATSHLDLRGLLDAILRRPLSRYLSRSERRRVDLPWLRHDR